MCWKMTKLTGFSIPRLVSKARKPKFDLILKLPLGAFHSCSTSPTNLPLPLQLIDLNNVPLTTGTSYIKWHLPTSTSTTSDNRGRTPSSPIKDHKVIWDYTHIIPIRLTIDKNNHLTECPVHFEVIQEYNSGVAGKVERVTLGQITLNLAEYVEESEVQSEEEEGVVRRYLLQDSKINSTVKIGIGMRQVEGERNFVAPALRSAPVFGGIAGIMKGDNGGEPMEGDAGHLPQTSHSEEKSELQDMYRRALAASWQAGIGEMSADECIEDIFAGGDGWKHDGERTPGMPVTPARIIHEDSLSTSASGEDLPRFGRGHRRTGSEVSTVSATTVGSKVRGGGGHRRKKSNEPGGRGGGGWDRGSVGASSGVGSPPSGDHDDLERERGRSGYKTAREVDEFDVRDDLVAWSLPRYVS
ncbi:respiratory complex assembly rmp1 protein [Rutstroemia sp. NJR-2017a BVV2]|nr:respiratory complex assembly rmp1 protein [Rutstroemia sp. NJR-2017a BVV2]